MKFWLVSENSVAASPSRERCHHGVVNATTEHAPVDAWGPDFLGPGFEARTLELLPDDEDDEDDEGTMVSLLDMASQLDIQAMESVLKMDKRYKVFAHVPEQRTAWVRAYLQSLSVPKRAVRLRNE